MKWYTAYTTPLVYRAPLTYTVHMQPNQPTEQPQQPAAERDTFQTFIPTKNPLSLWSYYCGIAGLLPFLGTLPAIAAIVTGILALRKYRENPTPGAKGHAITGIVLGSVELFIGLVFFIWFVASLATSTR